MKVVRTTGPDDPLQKLFTLVLGTHMAACGSQIVVYRSGSQTG